MRLANATRKKELWGSDLWKSLISGWKHSELTDPQLEEILQFLIDNEKILPSVTYEVSSLLEDRVKRTAPTIPPSALALSIVVAERLWSVCTVLDEKPRQEAEDWLFVALNRPAGMLTIFWLYAVSRLRRELAEQWTGLPQQYKDFFTSVLSGSSYAAEIGRVQLASQLNFLFSIDASWTAEHIIPLFSWSNNSRQALQMWHGYLGGGAWNEGLLPILLPYYEGAFPLLHNSFGDFRKQFCSQLAGIACFSSINPIKHGWLNRFIGLVGPEERALWASFIRPALQEMKEPAKQITWNSWIRGYWQNRIEGIPVPLDANEIRQMVQWSTHLGPVFPEVVTKIVNSPIPNLKDLFIYRELAESDLPTRHPVAVAKLVLYLLKHESTPIYDLDPVESILEKLVSMADKNELLKICDELARLGYYSAAQLRTKIEGTSNT